MTILKNSAKCVSCDEEIESTHRHDFKVHFCKVTPVPGRKWVKVGDKSVLVDTEEITFNFAVDGGKEYIRRVGGGYVDSSQFSVDPEYNQDQLP